jgi:hypothetical protein
MTNCFYKERDDGFSNLAPPILLPPTFYYNLLYTPLSNPLSQPEVILSGPIDSRIHLVPQAQLTQSKVVSNRRISQWSTNHRPLFLQRAHTNNLP